MGGTPHVCSETGEGQGKCLSIQCNVWFNRGYVFTRHCTLAFGRTSHCLQRDRKIGFFCHMIQGNVSLFGAMLASTMDTCSDVSQRIFFFFDNFSQFYVEVNSVFRANILLHPPVFSTLQARSESDNVTLWGGALHV